MQWCGHTGAIQAQYATETLSFVLEGALLCGLQEALRGRLVLAGNLNKLCSTGRWTNYVQIPDEVRGRETRRTREDKTWAQYVN